MNFLRTVLVLSFCFFIISCGKTEQKTEQMEEETMTEETVQDTAAMDTTAVDTMEMEAETE